MPFCQNCGSNVDAGKKFCENCGAAIGPIPGPSAIPTGIPYAPPAPQGQGPDAGYGIPPAEPKSAGLAAVGSFFFPGLGQVYNGSFGKGILVLFGTLIGYLFFFIPGILVWAYGIYDAYSTARKMNDGRIPFVAHTTSHMIAFVIIEIVVVIIYFIVLMAIITAAMIGMGGYSPYSY